MVALSAMCWACGGGFPVDEVPSDPIAFVHLEASKGIVGFQEFRDALRIPNPDDPESRTPRRKAAISLLVVPGRKISSVPDSSGDALPLDWSPDGIRLLMGRRNDARRTVELIVWNRLTGAYDRPTPDLSAGAAALGAGPIRLVVIGRSPQAGGKPRLGVHAYVDHRGLHALPDGVGGGLPDVAPDGRGVIFVRKPQRLNREPTIVLARLGESTARSLGRGSHPRFSRDGRWIAFTRNRNGNSDIWIMRANGSAKRALTSSSFDEEFPAVSPHGKYVVYSAVRGDSDSSQLYMTRVADGREIQITQTGQSSRPVW